MVAPVGEEKYDHSTDIAKESSGSISAKVYDQVTCKANGSSSTVIVGNREINNIGSTIVPKPNSVRDLLSPDF